MSEPWIKMRTHLKDDGRVRILKRKCNASTVTVCGALYFLWSLADAHADENGVIHGYKKEDIDELVELENFCESLPSEWMDLSGEYVKLPNYLEHNGSTAKKRATTQKRVSKLRREKKSCNAASVTPSPLLSSNNNIKDNSQPAEDLDIPKVQAKTKKPKVEKVTFAPKVRMTQKQADTLMAKHGNRIFHLCVRKLQLYKQSNGKSYKCDYSAILSWVLDQVLKDNPEPAVSNSPARKPFRGSEIASDFVSGLTKGIG